MLSPTLLSRRHLLRLSATGTAAIAVGAHWELLEGTAEASALTPALRRSMWNALHEPEITATSGAFTAPLELLQVADLPIADSIAGLRGHDGAFSLRFTGRPGLPQGPTTLAGPELGTIELFLTPVGRPAGSTQSYEAIIDRTVPVAGVNEEGTPEPVAVPEARGAQPATTTGASAQSKRRPAKTPVLRRAQVARTKSKRRVSVELSLADTRDIVGVRAVLMHGNSIVARAFSPQPAPHRLRLTLASPLPLSRTRYQLVVRMIARDGAVTSVRRSVKLS